MVNENHGKVSGLARHEPRPRKIQMRFRSLALFVTPLLLSVESQSTFAQTATPFDGRPWNISTGNFSVSFIQASPIGAFPRADFLEAPPSVESQVRLKQLGLVANEDYIAWGAIEREPGKWGWRQHDAMEKTLHEAGLKYVVYNWVHFPPVWLRDQPEQRTLMRCLEHGEETNYLSIFDPRTIEWYDHFYKHLHEHFGDSVDDVYACILGPYGEGNYPLEVTSYVDMGHCHEGYWCGDAFALKAFGAKMQARYGEVAKLNAAWGTSLKSFDDVRPPAEIATAGFKPSLEAFRTPQERRRWLDFITWYHQAIIDFTEQSLRTVLKYFPADRVRTKPGGNYGSVNPLPWGTYCPGYAKMAGRVNKDFANGGTGVVLQPADSQGALFADKWVGTAYQFYGVRECTEPAGNLIDQAFVQRMFSDATCGVAEHFTYEFERHAPNIQKYIHLYTGEPGETEIAVYCPTTLYRLGVNLHTTVASCIPLRDLCDFDVLDELLIADGALMPERYKALVLFQADVVDQPILDRIAAFQQAGGKVYVFANAKIKNVEGEPWTGAAGATRIAAPTAKQEWLAELATHLAGVKGVDQALDGFWTTRRGAQTFVFNSMNKPMTVTLDGKSAEVAPYTIYVSE